MALYPLRTKSYKEYVAEAMLMDMQYAASSHMFFPNDLALINFGDDILWYCAETMEPQTREQRKKRREEIRDLEPFSELLKWKGRVGNE